MDKRSSWRIRKGTRDRAKKAMAVVASVALTLSLVPLNAYAKMAEILPDQQGVAAGDSSSTAEETQDVRTAESSDIGAAASEGANASEIDEAEIPHEWLYRIVFDGNLPDNAAPGDIVTGEMSPVELDEASEAWQLPSNVFQREGYRFDRWSTTKDGKDVKDDPATADENEAKKAVAVPDNQEMHGIDFDADLVEDEENKPEPYSLSDFVTKNDEITLYA